MPGRVSAAELRRRWRHGEEVALLDVREEGPYSEAHPFFAVSLPLSRLELGLFDLVPRFDAPIVVYDDGGVGDGGDDGDDGEGLAERAAARIEALGYGDVSILAGGLTAYAAVGELFRDVNVPSKAFGELVESICHTPSLPAPEVQRLLDARADVAVLDARRFEEYRTMSIPTGVSVPGAELTLRVFDTVPSPDTLVVVNCAGRTRSIIGTQTLVNAGLPNRIVALRNGTIGWTLAGQTLDTGQTRRFGETSIEGHARARAAAERWADRVGVRTIDRATLQDWIAQARARSGLGAAARTLYRFDVRTPEEYAAGHPLGFISAPGGQLVQATDEWVAVRGARLVLFDDDGVRARMTAAWLVQMGWDAAVVEEGALEADEAGWPAARRPPLPEADAQAWAFITPQQLAARAAAVAVAVAADGDGDGDGDGTVTIVDLASSPAYAKGHIPGASFVVRSRFAEDFPRLPERGAIVLTSPDGDLARHAAADAVAAARASGDRPVFVLAGGTAAWTAAGLPLEHEHHHWISPAIDVYKRPYEGTDNAREAMQGYIDWELQLVAQLANDGVSNFHVVRPGVS